MANAYQYQAAKMDEIKKTLQGVLDGFHDNPVEIVELLAFKSQFYNYSMNNTVLIHHQNPHTTFVASYQDWNKKGYHVRQGQHGMKVLFPIRTELIQVGEESGKKTYRRVADATPDEKRMIENGQLKPVSFTRFGIGTVFDISQTDCPPEDYPKFFSMGYSSEQHAALYAAVKEFAGQKGFPVHETDLQSISLRGDFNRKTGEIRVSDKLNDTEKLSTLTHELGHALMHGDQKAKALPTEVKELEADCISIMLQRYVGLELTEERKRHFVGNYNACKNIKGFKIEGILKDVNRAYYDLHQELEPIFDRIVPFNGKEPQEQQAGEVIEKALNELYPGMKRNAGYYILDEVEGFALGFDPKAPDALVVWRKDDNGGYVNGVYRHTLNDYGRDLYNSGFHTDFIQEILNEVGYNYGLESKNAESKNEADDLLKRIDAFPLPKELNTFQQATVRCAVKRAIRIGPQEGQQFLRSYSESQESKGFPLSTETYNLITVEYDEMVAALSASDKPENMKQTENRNEAAASQKEQETSDKAMPQYTHFYYENRYLFTVSGENAAQKIYDRLTSEATHLGYSWTDGGKAYRSDHKETPVSDLWNADKSKTAYVPFTEELYDRHVKYLKKIFTPEQEPKPQIQTQSHDYKEQDTAVLDKIKYGVSIVALASDMGFTPKQIGGYYTLKEHDSVRIYPDTNSFNQFSSGIGGSTIDFVMRFGGYNKQEAIRYLKERYAGNVVEHPAVQTPEKRPEKVQRKTEFKLPDRAEGKYSRVFAYLTKTRCIDPEIVQQCFKDGMIYEDVKHNAVFVGKDADGTAAYATRRSTLTKSNFKCDVAGSRQDIGFYVNSPNAEKLYICEAPIDALSIMSLLKQQGTSLDHASYLATGGTGKDAALYTRLRENPQIKEVVLANDRDTAGWKANKKILEKLSKDFPHIKVAKLTPKQGKDINDVLKSRKNSPKTQVQGMEVDR